MKILYVRNLMLATSEETLESIFNQAAGHTGAVERVKKIKDYAFVHFYDRNDALRALNVINSMSVCLFVCLSVCLSLQSVLLTVHRWINLITNCFPVKCSIYRVVQKTAQSLWHHKFAIVHH